MDKMILDAVTLKSKTFLTEYVNGDFGNIVITKDNSNKFTLNDYATTIYVYGKLNFTIMMSFEESIIENIANTFLNGEEVKENEKMVIYNSVAKETINTVTGLSLSFFTNHGSGLSITPPIKMDDIKIKKFDNLTKFSEDLATKCGKLSISIIDYKIRSI